MAQTCTDLIVHAVFSTKERKILLENALKKCLWAYLGGIVRELGGKAIIINGASDHVHLLIQLPPTRSVADCLRIIKTNSSRWINESWSAHSGFAWQSGYGAFSIGRADLGAVYKYISMQEDHHRKFSFQEELLKLLREHAKEFNEHFLWQ